MYNVLKMCFPGDCENPEDVYLIQVIQGEALYLPCPNLQCSRVTNNSEISWFQNRSDGLWPITTEKSARVHYHGAVLYFLPLTLNDTGRYVTRRLLGSFYMTHIQNI